MRIVLDLTEEEVEKLEKQLGEWDSGPPYEGWRSDVLLSLEGKVMEAIKEAKKRA